MQQRGIRFRYRLFRQGRLRSRRDMQHRGVAVDRCQCGWYRRRRNVKLRCIGSCHGSCQTLAATATEANTGGIRRTAGGTGLAPRRCRGGMQQRGVRRGGCWSRIQRLAATATEFGAGGILRAAERTLHFFLPAVVMVSMPMALNNLGIIPFPASWTSGLSFALPEVLREDACAAQVARPKIPAKPAFAVPAEAALLLHPPVRNAGPNCPSVPSSANPAARPCSRLLRPRRFWQLNRGWSAYSARCRG